MDEPLVPRPVPILTTWVHPLDASALRRLILAWATQPGPARVIANHNLHSLALWRKHQDLRDYYAATDAIHIDGMPVVAWARWRDPSIGRVHRTSFMDWFPDLLDDAARLGLRLYWLGSPPDGLPRILATLRQRWPTLQVDGHHGFLTSADEPVVIHALTAFAPHLILVGMGMPRQERWISRWRKQIPSGVILPCGAAGEYLAGLQPLPPRWSGRLGVEWLWRLLHDPRRLAHRYLIEPLGLLLPVLADRWAASRGR